MTKRTPAFSPDVRARAVRMSGWRDAFLAAGEASLTTRPKDGETLDSERLKAKLGDMVMKTELLEATFHGEGHRKVWARLRFAGLRTSRHRVLRLMREHALLAPARTGSPWGRATTTARSSPTGSTPCGAPT